MCSLTWEWSAVHYNCITERKQIKIVRYKIKEYTCIQVRHPGNSSQMSFPSSVEHCNFIPDFSSYPFFQTIFSLWANYALRFEKSVFHCNRKYSILHFNSFQDAQHKLEHFPWNRWVFCVLYYFLLCFCRLIRLGRPFSVVMTIIEHNVKYLSMRWSNQSSKQEKALGTEAEYALWLICDWF